MSIIKAYKSDTDGKIFEHEKDYKAHLVKLAKARAFTRKLEKIKQNWDNFILEMGNTVKNEDELISFVMKNQEKFILHALDRDAFNVKPKKNENGRTKNIAIKKFELYDRYKYGGQSSVEFHLNWKNEVSNSHGAPRDGITNWGGKVENGPRSYPGWTGVCTIELEGFNSFLTDIFRDTPLKTGSGGNQSYEFYIFASDFKCMSYHSLLKDFKNNKPNVDKRRVLFVLDNAADFINEEDETFKKIIEKFSKEPDFEQKILERKLEKPQTRAKKLKI